MASRVNAAARNPPPVSGRRGEDYVDKMREVICDVFERGLKAGRTGPPYRGFVDLIEFAEAAQRREQAANLR